MIGTTTGSEVEPIAPVVKLDIRRAFQANKHPLLPLGFWALTKPCEREIDCIAGRYVETVLSPFT